LQNHDSVLIYEHWMMTRKSNAEIATEQSDATAVRDVERQLIEYEAWAQKPKPKAPIPQPTSPAERTAFMEKRRL
jgi:hypothetical protein